ncbi:MAG: ABC transporter ATP-binding protein [Lachnospiraceae bacterium]|nr:ABC transporter ATP-binding protein [Lachnospiraceae bacterium]
MSRKTKLQVKNLSRIYEGNNGPVVALQDVNLEVEESEFVMIVGPSGCGKTTLINIIGGLDEATSGEVLLDGTPVSAPGADRGMVFQGYSLFPWLNVQKNVEFGLKMKGIPAAERAEQAQKYIELVGLKGFETALPKQLSGGMKQRVAIARTLANEPQVLLMDEPFGALDAQTRVVMQELLADISRRTGTTILFITHDIDEAVLLGERVYVMSRRPGTVRDVITVDIPGERSHNSLVLPEFLETKKQIMDMLWQESQDAALGR